MNLARKLFKKVIEGKEDFSINNKAEKVLAVFDTEVSRLSKLSEKELVEYQLLDSYFERKLLQHYPCLESLRKHKVMKDKVNRYQHTLDFLKGYIALALGKNGYALFINSIVDQQKKGHKQLGKKQYLDLVELARPYIAERRTRLLFITAILLHESGNTEKWNPRHYQSSAEKTDSSLYHFGYDDSWRELGRFLVEHFCYLRELLLGEASLDFITYLAKQVGKMPVPYNNKTMLIKMAKLLTLLDLNASQRVSLTSQIVELVKSIELDNDREEFKDNYRKNRLVLLRADLTDLKLSNSFQRLYVRYIHSILDTKDDDDHYILGKHSAEELLNSLCELQREAVKINKNFNFIIFERMDKNAINELKQKLRDPLLSRVAVIYDTDIYFLDHEVFFEGEYLVIDNK